MTPHDEGGEAPCFEHLLEKPPGALDADALAQFVRCLADAVVIADTAGRITFWNRAAGELFGWSEAEAMGQTLDLIIPERLRSRHWDGSHRVMGSGETENAGRLLEVPALHRDGRRLSVAFTVTMVQPSGHQTPTAIAAVIRDDTEAWLERRRTRERLAELETARGGPAAT
jgi:PAS domain S-box-containing protein